MHRLLVPTLGVLFLAALIGCGGSGGGTLVTDASTATTTSTTSGDTTGTTARALAGDYAASLAGRGSSGTTFTGSGSGVVAADGTVTVDYTSLEGGATTTTTRRLVAAVTTAGVASGSVTVGTTPYALTSGTLTKNANGTYTLTTAFDQPATDTPFTETDTFTLTATNYNYSGANSGFDDQGATYGGSGMANVVRGNTLSLSYASIRQLGGASTTQTHTIVSLALLSGGTFSGTLDLAGSSGTGTANVPVTGTWSLSSALVLVLTLNYTNTRIVSGTGRNPVVSETLTLGRL